MTDVTDMDALKAATIPKSVINDMKEAAHMSLRPISGLEGFPETPAMKGLFKYLPIEHPPTEQPIRFLSDEPGMITVTEITGKFVLTGPMSGCYLSIFELNGKKYLAHLGTGEGFKEKNEAMKEVWKHAVNETSLKQAVEYYWNPHANLKDLPVVKKGWDKELTKENILEFLYAGAVLGSGGQIRKYSIVFGKCENISSHADPQPQATGCFKKILSMKKKNDIDLSKVLEYVKDRHFSEMILQDAPAESRPPTWLNK